MAESQDNSAQPGGQRPGGHPADAPDSVGIVQTQTVRVVEADDPLPLDCGKRLGPIDVAYETYGQLSPERDNVVLICHALSGDAHVAGYHSRDDRKPGWWDIMVGPGKGIDTNKYFVICSNVLGGCRGTTGPGSIDPATGRPYGLGFPIVTIADMVRVQKRLLDKLGIERILCVLGGSMGGMQALQWTVAYPERVHTAAIIASTTKLGAQAIAFDAVGRNAILADPNFDGGHYHDGRAPDAGLSIARMIGHITYLSEKGMHDKFGRLGVRRRDVPGLPGPDFRRAFRRQQLPVHHQGDGLFRPGGRGWRRPDRGPATGPQPVPGYQFQQRLAVYAPAVRGNL